MPTSVHPLSSGFSVYKIVRHVYSSCWCTASCIISSHPPAATLAARRSPDYVQTMYFNVSCFQRYSPTISGWTVPSLF